MRLRIWIRGAALLSHRWKHPSREGAGDEARRFVQTRARVQQAVETEQTLSTKAVYTKVKQRLGTPSTTPIVKSVKNDLHDGSFMQISRFPTLTVVISGPSGVGKDTVIRELQKQREHLHFVVTATSRAKRENEVDGVDYQFVSKQTFENWIREDKMFEYATVYGHYKGVPKSQIEDAFRRGQDCVLRLDVQGAAHVQKLSPDCISIYISPQSEDELVKRLISRKTESMEDMLVRVKTAREELQRSSEFDYLVLNKEGAVDQTVARICSIIDAEKSKRARLCLNI